MTREKFHNRPRDTVLGRKWQRQARKNWHRSGKDSLPDYKTHTKCDWWARFTFRANRWECEAMVQSTLSTGIRRWSQISSSHEAIADLWNFRSASQNIARRRIILGHATDGSIGKNGNALVCRLRRECGRLDDCIHVIATVSVTCCHGQGWRSNSNRARWCL